MTCRLASQIPGGRCLQEVTLAMLGELLNFEIDPEATLTVCWDYLHRWC